MYTNQKPFFIRVITPLHAGTGSDIGIIDMPIQRERHTNFPKIESSGLKGSLRDYFETTPKEKDEINLVFGPDNDKNAHAAAFALTDAAVLFFPVKSAKGVYALITCPSVLKRFFEFRAIKLKEDATPVKIENAANALKKIDEDKANPLGDGCWCTKYSPLVLGEVVVLEEFALKAKNDDGGLMSALKDYFTFLGKDKTDKIVCVSDEVFRDFVTLSTELITRNKINAETGTVQKGALFSEEFLPPETILYSFLQTGPVNIDENNKKYDKYTEAKKNIEKMGGVEQFLDKGFPTTFQIGGDATIGKGIVKVYWEKENKPEGKHE